jgi:hypothetical protein
METRAPVVWVWVIIEAAISSLTYLVHSTKQHTYTAKKDPWNRQADMVGQATCILEDGGAAVDHRRPIAMVFLVVGSRLRLDSEAGTCPHACA